MRVSRIHGWRRLAVAVAVAVAAGLMLTGLVSMPHALAAGSSSITGVVEDTAGTPLADVAVNVLDPGTGATDANTTTASDGTFTAAVDPGTYNVQFVPPSDSGLQTYLASGVSAGSAPLTIVLTGTSLPTQPAQIKLQGTLADSSGGLNAQDASLTFSSALNPGVTAGIATVGSTYSATLNADQNVTATLTVRSSSAGPAVSDTFTLPLGTLSQSQTLNLTVPTARLTVSLRDASGNPVTGAHLSLSGTVSSLPGLSGATATVSGLGAALDSSGDVTVALPEGITPDAAKLTLADGTSVPFTAPTMNGDQQVTVTAPATPPPPPTIKLQGTLADSSGGLNAQDASLTFSSALNPGVTVGLPDVASTYSATLTPDQDVTATVVVRNAFSSFFINDTFTLPLGTLSQSQTLNITVPTNKLTVSLRDPSGNPVTGASLSLGGTTSSLPGLPGATATVSGDPQPLDSSGDITVVLPAGITPANAEITLADGTTVPFTAPTMNGDQQVTVTAAANPPPPPTIKLQGTLADSSGGLNAENASLTFSSPLNPGVTVGLPDVASTYSATLTPDQDVTATVIVRNGSSVGPAVGDTFTLPLGTLSQSQTLNITVPTNKLTVSLRDPSGNPVTGASLSLGGTTSSLPGLPGATATVSGLGTSLDSSGNATVVLPEGITPTNAKITLSNGTTVPFTAPTMNGDQQVFVIFNSATGTSTVGDQPTCTTIITGSHSAINVTSGVTCLSSATLNGSITVGAGAVLSVSHSTIKGTVTVTGAASVTFCGVTEDGTLSISGTTGGVTLGGTLPDGSACAADTIPSLITISGTAGPVTVSGLSENGTLTLSGNTGGVTLSGVKLSGLAYVQNNTGTAPIVISGNSVNGSLSCTGNTPAPGDNGSVNTVTGTAGGQCATLAVR